MHHPTALHSVTESENSTRVLICLLYILNLQSYAYQMIKGLEYCHIRGVMHR